MVLKTDPRGYMGGDKGSHLNVFTLIHPFLVRNIEICFTLYFDTISWETNYKRWRGIVLYIYFKIKWMCWPCFLFLAISVWNAQGGQTWQLLEPVDGFHSNQYGQALTAQVTWEEAEKLMPQVFGPVNPANEKIAQIFGSQGGYWSLFRLRKATDGIDSSCRINIFFKQVKCFPACQIIYFSVSLQLVHTH